MGEINYFFLLNMKKKLFLKKVDICICIYIFEKEWIDIND